MMEYLVIYLRADADSATAQLNELAKAGWRVSCVMAERGVILERQWQSRP